MALTPELDVLIARIKGIDALIAALDGKQPIDLAIGAYKITIDPATMPEAYSRGRDTLINIANSAQNDLRSAVVTIAVEQSQDVAVTVTPLPPTPLSLG